MKRCDECQTELPDEEHADWCPHATQEQHDRQRRHDVLLTPAHAEGCTQSDFHYSGSGYNRVRVCACGSEDHAPAASHAYTVRIEGERDLATFDWLDARGYAGDLHAIAGHCTVERDSKGTEIAREYKLTEAEAWAFHEYVESDRGAFLACNASDTLNSALLSLFDMIN